MLNWHAYCSKAGNGVQRSLSYPCHDRTGNEWNSPRTVHTKNSVSLQLIKQGNCWQHRASSARLVKRDGTDTSSATIPFARSDNTCTNRAPVFLRGHIKYYYKLEDVDDRLFDTDRGWLHAIVVSGGQPLRDTTSMFQRRSPFIFGTFTAWSAKRNLCICTVGSNHDRVVGHAAS